MSEIIPESVEEIEAAIPFVDVSEDLEVATSHLEEVSQGTIDTIDGMEGHSLTNAQRYLNSVLYANGDVPSSVMGAEGVLSTVKGWATKALDAIKRAFAAIWNYLFGKKDIEQEVKLLRNDIKETVEKVNKFKGEAKSTESKTVIQLANNYTQAAAEVKATDPGLAKQYEDAAEKLKEKPTITSMTDSRFVLDEKLYKKIKAIANAADHHVKKCAEDYSELRLAIHDQANLSELSIDPKANTHLGALVNGIKTPDDVTKTLATLDQHISGYGIANTIKSLKSNRTKIDGKIKRWESEIASADAQEQKALRNDISDMQLMGRMIKSVVSRLEAQLNATKRLAKMIPKLHRLPA